MRMGAMDRPTERDATVGESRESPDDVGDVLVAEVPDELPGPVPDEKRGAVGEVGRFSTFGRFGRFGRFERTLLLIALAGLVFRIGYIMVTRDDTHLCDNLLCGDALFYGGQANTIGLGQGFHDYRNWHIPSADHPPLTAVFLAPATVIFGGDPIPIVPMRILMALAGFGVIIAIGYLGRKVGRSRGNTVGLWAAGIAAVNANFWMNDVLLMSETLATLGIVISLIAIYRFIDKPTVVRTFVIGAAVGVTALARAELLLLLPITFVPVVVMAKGLSWTARIGRMALAGIVTLAVLAPWIGYNMVRFTEPVLLSTNDGLTLLGANCDGVYGWKDVSVFDDPNAGRVDDWGGAGFWRLSCTEPFASQVPVGADQSVVNRIYRDAGIDYINNHKRRAPLILAVREGRVWGVYGPDQIAWLNQGEGRLQGSSYAGYGFWWLMVIPSGIGLVLLHRRRVPIWPLASTAVIVTLTVAVFYGIVRFRLPADVAATVLTAVAIDAWFARRQRRSGADGADGAHSAHEHVTAGPGPEVADANQADDPALGGTSPDDSPVGSPGAGTRR